MNAKLGLALVLLILTVIFTLQNIQVITIRFLFWEFSLSRALVIFVIFAMGVFIGVLLGRKKGKK